MRSTGWRSTSSPTPSSPSQMASSPLMPTVCPLPCPLPLFRLLWSPLLPRSLFRPLWSPLTPRLWGAAVSLFLRVSGPSRCVRSVASLARPCLSWAVLRPCSRPRGALAGSRRLPRLRSSSPLGVRLPSCPALRPLRRRSRPLGARPPRRRLRPLGARLLPLPLRWGCGAPLSLVLAPSLGCLPLSSLLPPPLPRPRPPLQRFLLMIPLLKPSKSAGKRSPSVSGSGTHWRTKTQKSKTWIMFIPRI